jgi:hypothetical protein
MTGQSRSWSRTTGILKFAAGVIGGAGLSCVLASAATQAARHDGSFWKGLGNQDKTAYVAGYSDAMHISQGKLDSLKVAAAAFHWKGAGKILSEVARTLDMSGVPAHDLVAYLDNVYSSSRYGDFEIANAIELAQMKAPSISVSATAAKGSDAQH